VTALARRSIHLDFHTAPEIPGVGADFDAHRFARHFVEADVDSVTVFAKCHHGRLYYDTDRPERHPNLTCNLLDEQVESLHRVGIRAPIYLSVEFDEHAAALHPEWVAVDEEGRPVKQTPRFTAGWMFMDMASPYQDYVADQLADVLDHFGEVDGIFLDICMDVPSTSVWAVAAMKQAGLDPESAVDRSTHARRLSRSYMQRYRDMILPHLAAEASTSVWFNSRPKTELREELSFVDHVEIEALPTGGWGYSYLPYVARLVRPMGKPTLAHTARFHKSWGDNAGLKPAAALDYECSQMLALGISACIGDVLHPSGRLMSAAYDLIGNTYRRIRECEPFVAGTTPLSEVAVIMDLALGDEPGPDGVGVVRALQQHRQQFDIIGLDASPAGYRLVVVPESIVIDEAMAERLQEHVAGGGSLLVSGAAAIGPDGGPSLPMLGIEVEGPSPFQEVFVRPTGTERGSPEHEPVVDYERGIRMRAVGAGTAVYEVVEPYFARTWDRFCGHDYTPPGRDTDYAALVLTERTAVLSTSVFTGYATHAAEIYRTLVRTSLNHLLPDPLVRLGGPLHVETGVVAGDGVRVLHVISYLASRQAEGRSPITQEIEGLDLVYDPFPILDVPVSLRVEAEPTSVTLEPAGTKLQWSFHDGYMHTSVTVTDGHAMIVVHT
jgi:hypothetical protein